MSNGEEQGGGTTTQNEHEIAESPARKIPPKDTENSCAKDASSINWANRVMASANVAMAFISVGAFWILFRQFGLQQLTVDRVWEAQQIAIIYETRECAAPPCSPVASLRSREEAVKAYLHLRQHNGAPVDLRGVDLSGQALLPRVDFSRANLERARFPGAHLEDSVFESAQLIGAEMSDAWLERADFSGATLGDWKQFNSATGECFGGASLRRAHLDGADLRGATLCGVDVRDTNLSGAKGLTQAQIENANGNEYTILPPSPPGRPRQRLHPPARWLK